MTDATVARQVRLHIASTAAVRRLGRFPGRHRLIKTLQRSPLTAGAYRALVGFQRPFTSLSKANEAIAAYANQGHLNLSGIELHLGLNDSTRPSDYAAMFHIRPLLQAGPRISDLGGNVGNLFYCYSSYLMLPPALVWQVHDLAPVIARGRELAKQRGVAQLAFTDGR